MTDVAPPENFGQLETLPFRGLLQPLFAVRGHQFITKLFLDYTDSWQNVLAPLSFRFLGVLGLVKRWVRFRVPGG